MLNPYTRKERKAIIDAWDMVFETLDAYNYKHKNDWREALRLDKRQTSCSVTSKALMLREFDDAATNTLRAKDLYGIREGLRLAHMIGADYPRERMSHHVFNAIKTALVLYEAARDRGRQEMRNQMARHTVGRV